MKNKYKISKNEYFIKPYPHIIKDNFFDDRTLKNILYNWPDENLFSNEIPGIKLLDLFHSTQRTKHSFLEFFINLLKKKRRISSESLDFWTNFLKFDIPKINSELYKTFKFDLFSKFSIKKTPDISQLNLMQASNLFIEHHVHNHHYHNPNWTFTVLIYLDDNNLKTPGTDIYEPKYNHKEEYKEFLTKFSITNPILSANSKKLLRSKTVEFKKNRLFAFLDSPISYHGVKKTNLSKNFKNGSRKILRLHCSYNEKTVNKIYGMDLKEYKKIRSGHPKKLLNNNNIIYKGVKFEIDNLLKNR